MVINWLIEFIYYFRQVWTQWTLEQIIRLVVLSFTVCLCTHRCSDSASSNTVCYINLPPLQQSGSSFCFPFPCVYISLLGGTLMSAFYSLFIYFLTDGQADNGSTSPCIDTSLRQQALLPADSSVANSPTLPTRWSRHWQLPPRHQCHCCRSLIHGRFS